MKKIFLLCTTFFICATMQAQVVVHAVIDDPNVMMNTPFQFGVTMEGNGNFTHTEFPAMSGFQIVQGQSSTSQSYSYVNGKWTQSKTSIYFLIPIKEGKQTIPSVNAFIDGKAYSTKPIEVMVAKGNVPAQQARGGSTPQQQQKGTQNTGVISGNKDVFIKPIVEKSSLYVGEGTVITYKLYSKINFLRYEPEGDLKPEGFWVERFDLGKTTQMTTEYLNGSMYRVATVNKILAFPSREGKLTIQPYNAVCEALESEVRRGNGYMFDDLSALFGIGGRTVQVKIACPAVSITVKPLPKPQPESFTGAVGSFTFNAKVDKPAMKMGELNSIKIDVAGEGNIRGIGKTLVQLPADFQSREPVIKQSTDKQANTMTGKISEEILIEPNAPGDLKIGKIDFTYFDPKKLKYVTLTSQELSVKVTENPNGFVGSSYTNKKDIQKLGSDVRFIKTDASTLTQRKKSPIYQSSIFYFLMIIPFLALFGMIFIQRREEKFSSDNSYRRNYFASPEAKKRLKTAKTYMQTNNQKSFFAEIESAVLRYVGDKYDTDIVAMTKEEVKTFMESKNVPTQMIAECMNILETSELCRYSPSSKTTNDLKTLYSNAEQIISKI